MMAFALLEMVITAFSASLLIGSVVNVYSAILDRRGGGDQCRISLNKHLPAKPPLVLNEGYFLYPIEDDYIVVNSGASFLLNCQSDFTNQRIKEHTIQVRCLKDDKVTYENSNYNFKDLGCSRLPDSIVKKVDSGSCAGGGRLYDIGYEYSVPAGLDSSSGRGPKDGKKGPRGKEDEDGKEPESSDPSNDTDDDDVSVETPENGISDDWNGGSEEEEEEEEEEEGGEGTQGESKSGDELVQGEVVIIENVKKQETDLLGSNKGIHNAFNDVITDVNNASRVFGIEVNRIGESTEGPISKFEKSTVQRKRRDTGTSSSIKFGTRNGVGYSRMGFIRSSRASQNGEIKDLGILSRVFAKHPRVRRSVKTNTPKLTTRNIKTLDDHKMFRRMVKSLQTGTAVSKLKLKTVVKRSAELFRKKKPKHQAPGAGKTEFVRLIQVCYDVKRHATIYAVHNVDERIRGRQHKVQRPYFKPNIFEDEKIDVNYLYTRKGQIRRLTELLGSEDLANKYVHGDYYLARGHYSPKADFIHGAEQTATFYYINVAPQWQVFNGGNWVSLEEAVRRLIEKEQGKYQVYTGGSDVITLPDKNNNEVEIYLGEKDGRKIVPVPKYYWKVIYNSDKQEGFAVVGINNPYLKVKEEDIICEDICHAYDWIDWNIKDPKGYMFCCCLAQFQQKFVNLGLNESVP